MTDVPEFDPLPADRVWFRHAQTGDRGYSVRRQGKDAVRYDRGPHIDQYSYNLSEWKPDDVVTPQFSAIQIAQVAFEADKKLCWALGLPELAKREWLDLSEKRRILWVNEGPQAKDACYARRARMWAAIQAEMTAP